LALLVSHDAARKFPAVSNQGTSNGTASVWWPTPGSAVGANAAPSPGYTTGGTAAAASAGYSWIVKILPYMDEANLYNSISQASAKLTADAFTPYTSTVSGTGAAFAVSYTSGTTTISRHFCTVQLDQVACPSYAGTPQVAGSPLAASVPPVAYGPNTTALGSTAQSATVTNYVALAATHYPLMAYSAAPYATTTPTSVLNPNGMIVPGTGLNMKACTDGSSKTVMICETIEPAVNCWYDGTTAWTTGISPGAITSGTNPTTTISPLGYWTPGTGLSLQTAMQVGPSPVATVSYSNGIALVPWVTGTPAAPISWGPSSNHSGGVVVHGAVDGSVHNLTPDTDPTVYMHIITRAGREPDALPDTTS
jgi:hypothetical protein